MSQDELNALIHRTEAFIEQVIAEAESEQESRVRGGDLPLYKVVRYHLGWLDGSFQPVSARAGKRIRPLICLLCAGAAGSRTDAAIPVAAAIELLHNFTLMHDDIQDRSEVRHGRPTVWVNWGQAQAINTGDATFALSQLAIFKSLDQVEDAGLVSLLAREFNKVTLRIVEGQVLDLGFELRWDIREHDYLRMIEGKTAAIVGFAAWAGALASTGDRTIAERYRQFGLKLGLGFQIRDDYLGVWGDEESTGKAAGDDIRRRKKSIPVVMLLDELSDSEGEELRAIYKRGDLHDESVQRVVQLLAQYNIAGRVQQLSARYHDEALELLQGIAAPSPQRDALESLAERLVERTY